jgi:5-methyltetrahydropteroyltriglutamate--homocysteine methyltransferase
VQDWGVAALERATEGLRAETAVHICYGYGIEARNKWKETLGAEWRLAEVLRRALEFVDADKLIPRSNCGMAPLARGAALGKLSALSAGADIVRAELANVAVPAAR